jgi:hypothetical protein
MTNYLTTNQTLKEGIGRLLKSELFCAFLQAGGDGIHPIGEPHIVPVEVAA